VVSSPPATVTGLSVHQRRPGGSQESARRGGLSRRLWSTASFDDVLGPGTWFNGTKDPGPGPGRRARPAPAGGRAHARV